MVNKFLQYLQYEKNYSSHTVLSYTNDLDQFQQFLTHNSKNTNPENADFQDIQQWLIHLLSEGVSTRTISRKTSTLKSFWRYLLKQGYAKKNPTLKIISPKTNKPLPVFFKQREIETTLNNPYITEDFETQRNHLIIKLFYLTGIRLSELINLTDNNIESKAFNIRVTGKRNKQRIIPIGESLCEDIKKYISLRDSTIEDREPYLFVRKNGKKTYPKMIYNIVHNKMSQTSTASKKSPHILRHNFATEMLNGGADINAVKELLGHNSLAATQVYTHTSFDELHNIYKNAHPRAK